MNNIVSVVTSAICLAGIAVPAVAQQPPEPKSSGGIPYVGIAGAYSLLDDVHVHPMDAPYTPGRASERFGPGGAAAAVVGYAFGNGFAAELEAAYDYNVINNLEPTTPHGKQTGNQSTYGGFVNGIYTFDLPAMGMDLGFVKPYVGVGVGALTTHVTAPLVAAGNVFVNHIGGTSGPNFAYQSIVGGAFPISAVPGLAFFSDYRFIGINDPDHLHSNFYTSAGLSKGPIKLSPAFVNLFVVGFAYAFGAPAAAAPVAPMPISVAPVQPTRTYLVFFDWDKADLSPRANQIIADAATASTHVQTTRIEVNGYTDLSGTAKYNLGLSERRGKAVMAALVHGRRSSHCDRRQGLWGG